MSRNSEREGHTFTVLCGIFIRCHALGMVSTNMIPALIEFTQLWGHRNGDCAVGASGGNIQVFLEQIRRASSPV